MTNYKFKKSQCPASAIEHIKASVTTLDEIAWKFWGQGLQ